MITLQDAAIAVVFDLASIVPNIAIRIPKANHANPI